MKPFALSAMVLALLSAESYSEAQSCQEDSIKASNSPGRFNTQENQTVIDTFSGLEWQKCAVGLKGDNCESGQAALYTWGDALKFVHESYAAESSVKSSEPDWRLPTIKELASLSELQCANPAIDETYFPNTPSAHTWTSSPYKFYPHYSWYVNFQDGGFSYGDRTDKKNIRLVRQITD